VRFEWDENKDQANISRHDGVRFDDATKVFSDIWAIEEADPDHSTADEKRFTIIGLADSRLLRVTYKIIGDKTADEVIRINSARIAKTKDKESYENARNKYDR